MKVTFSGNKGSADSQVRMRSLSPNPIGLCPHGQGKCGHRDRSAQSKDNVKTEGEQDLQAEGCQKLGEGPRADSPSQPAEGTNPAHTLTSDCARIDVSEISVL